MAALRQAADSTSAQLAELQALADKRVLQATAAAAEEAEQCRRSWREEFEKRRQLQNEVCVCVSWPQGGGGCERGCHAQPA
jgi:hypothetical protein